MKRKDVKTLIKSINYLVSICGSILKIDLSNHLTQAAGCK